MESIFRFLLMPIVWIPIVVILIVLTVRNYRKANRLRVLNVGLFQIILLKIPVSASNLSLLHLCKCRA